MGTLHFKSKEAYRKWLAHGHMHSKRGLLVHAKAGRKSVFASSPGSQKIVIRGKPHQVKHKY